ncbi:hypothetical protein PhiZZ30_148 [Serratia phage PhiZZ30]|uniref:Uncharacterized protein n=1 Tax=Serratia phage PhiZZ30 TaxID=2716729 RepID=A0A6G8R8W2_9CAUD|nr:hypothetical protein KMC30_gp265 [Serratia phage PhiZZ30]QIN97809.1 hypothetical protein PhiZZ30_148 [Serratia phage PhiZZ30]
MSINEYYVYAGDYANPSHFEGNLIPDKVFNTPFEAWSWIESKNGFSYRYVEVTDWRGTKYPKDHYYVNPSKVNFLLFAGDNYYPCGGYDDLIAYAETEDKLRDIIKENENKPDYGSNRFDWWQIVNAHTHAIIDRG